MFYNEFEIGEILRHKLRKTITEAENVLFCGMTLNTQPLHIDRIAAAASPFGQPIVNGILTMGVVVGISVPDLTADSLVANMGYESVKHPNPVFHGDTIEVFTEVLEKRLSASKPNCGLVTFKHIGKNQDGKIVCEVIRTALLKIEA